MATLIATSRAAGPTQSIPLSPSTMRLLMKQLRFGVAYGASPKTSTGLAMESSWLRRTLPDALPDALPDTSLPAGYHPVCAACPQGLNCMRKKLPSVCNHCRRIAPPLTALDLRILQISTTKELEVTICEGANPATRIGYGEKLFQYKATRAPAACPLFHHSLMTCGRCAKPRQMRVYVQTSKYKRKRLKVPGMVTALAPRETLKDWVIKKQRAPQNLHERAVYRHEQKNRRPARGARDGVKTKR